MTIQLQTKLNELAYNVLKADDQTQTYIKLLAQSVKTRGEDYWTDEQFFGFKLSDFVEDRIDELCSIRQYPHETTITEDFRRTGLACINYSLVSIALLADNEIEASDTYRELSPWSTNYNGWRNQPTWLAALLIDNDRKLQDFAWDVAQSDKLTVDNQVMLIRGTFETAAHNYKVMSPKGKELTKEAIETGLTMVNWSDVIAHYAEIA